MVETMTIALLVMRRRRVFVRLESIIQGQHSPPRQRSASRLAGDVTRAFVKKKRALAQLFFLNSAMKSTSACTPSMGMAL